MAQTSQGLRLQWSDRWRPASLREHREHWVFAKSREAAIERADRLEERGELPFIVIDAAERVVDIPLLQFPLWLAFAAGPDELVLDEDLY